MKIMLADDDRLIRQLVGMITADHGYGLYLAIDGVEAMDVFEAERPDLVILDVMMPRMDGFEVCSKIRAIDPDVPILFLSAKGDVADRVTGLRMGADDYLPKPFDEEELLLRVESLLRRRSAQQRIDEATNGGDSGASVVDIGRFSFDQKRFSLQRDGVDTGLTLREFQILFLLASHPGEVFPASEIISAFWGDEYQDESISIPVYVRRIRSKMEDDPSHPRYLRTIRGSGYSFEP